MRRMKRVFQNLVALFGLLLMVASFVWMQLHHAERPVARTEPRAARSSTVSKPFAVVVLDPGHGGQDSGAMCGGLFYGDRFRVRRTPKARISLDLFRKHWLRAPGPQIVAYKPDSFS